MTKRTDTHRVGPLGLYCTNCNSNHAVYALSYPIFAWGIEGGTSGADEYECTICDHRWPIPSQ